MAKFRYRMQNILDIKEKLEGQAKIAFSQANAALIEEQNKLADLMQRRSDYEEELKAASSGDLDFREIKRLKGAIDIMKSMIRDQMLEVHKAQRNLDMARAHLDEVMKERKTHENLKERAFEEFKEELKAEESKANDQLVSYTYKNNNGEI